MFKRIDHVEIIPSNFQKSVDFYCNVLEFKAVETKSINSDDINQVAYLSLGDTTLELIDVVKSQSASKESWQVGYSMMALEVEDMDQAIEYLKANNIAITWGPVDLGDSVRAEINDPDGLTIELRQW